MSASYKGKISTDKKKMWRAAAYIRLSKEDYDSKRGLISESNSISAQRRIIKEYADNKDDIIVMDYYVDDGYSGSTSDRPDFQRMLRDIEHGYIDCVIVKDSTRFMRNQSEVIKYRDELFIEKGVRYICVIDNTDRLPNQQKRTGEFLSDSIKDIFNEYYLVEASEKIRSSLDIRRKNGLFIGSHAPYGYMKDPSNKHKLIVDEDASQIVKQIYNSFLEGSSISNIVRQLNQQGVDNPTYYKNKNGQKVNNNHFSNTWSDKTVRRILSDEVYIGNLIQKKNLKVSYKVKKMYAVPEDEQIRVENTHEAIIDKNIFTAVQSMLNKGGHSSPSIQNIDLFSGFVVCGDCGRKMSLKTNRYYYGTYRYYRCVTNTKTGIHICHLKPSIRTDILEDTILKSIQKYARIAINLEKAVKEINAVSKEQVTSLSLEKQLQNQEKELAKTKKAKLNLFTSYSEEIITKDEYLELKEHYTNEIQKIENNISSIQNELESLSETIVKQNKFVEHFKKYGDVDHLTRSMLTELVDEIIVYDKNRIEITFNFEDIFKKTVEFVENSKSE